MSLRIARVERPQDTEYAPYYAGYVARVPETDIVAVLEEQPGLFVRIAETLPAEQADFRYAPGKWSVRDIFGHLIDGERVFGYRLLCVGRGDRASLPGFDEKAYVAAARPGLPGLAELAAEFACVRESNLHLARRLDEEEWARAGIANGSPVTARAIAYIIAGHVRHHLAVLDAKYDVRAE